MIIIVDKNIPFAEKAFHSLGEVKGIDTADFKAENIRGADVLIVRSETKVNGALLDGNRVKFIGTPTSGTDHLDIPYLNSQEIIHANAPGCNANSVKEYVVAALLNLARVNGFSLKGKTIGVIGVGNIGSKIVKAADALGMAVLQNDPPLARTTGDKKFHPLDRVLHADIITLHVPLTKTGPDATFHLFNRDRIGRMNPGVIFINTSRGAVVDSVALKEAIAEKRIAATVIDVWENEPHFDSDLLPLITIATPHIAGYSIEGKMNAVWMVRETFCRFFAIEAPWDPLDEIGFTGDTEIHPTAEKLPAEEVLHRIVKSAYDIALDDEQLRRLSSLPPDQFAREFMKLRTGYGVRREFSNWTVFLPPAHAAVEGVIRELDFKIDYSSRLI
ncbi:MAG: 4-phosphoerythronate dehydrogenase [Bacteroidota bacterium]